MCPFCILQRSRVQCDTVPFLSLMALCAAVSSCTLRPMLFFSWGVHVSLPHPHPQPVDWVFRLEKTNLRWPLAYAVVLILASDSFQSPHNEPFFHLYWEIVASTNDISSVRRFVQKIKYNNQIDQTEFDRVISEVLTDIRIVTIIRLCKSDTINLIR